MSKKKYNKSINTSGDVVSNEENTTEETTTPNPEEIKVTIETEEKVQKTEHIEVTVETQSGVDGFTGMASESDDNSNIAVENEETHEVKEEEVSTANVENKKGCSIEKPGEMGFDSSLEEPEVALAQIQPVEGEIYVKILTDSKKEELIKSRLFNAGIAYAQTTDGIIVAGPCKTYDEAVALKKKIAGCGLRCTIR